MEMIVVKKRIISILAICLLATGIMPITGIGNPGEPELALSGTTSIIDVELV